MRKIITVLVVLTGVLLYRIYKAGESIVLEQDTDRIGQRRQWQYGLKRRRMPNRYGWRQITGSGSWRSRSNGVQVSHRMRMGFGKSGSGQQRLFASATWWGVCRNRQNRRGRASCRMRSCGAADYKIERKFYGNIQGI